MKDEQWQEIVEKIKNQFEVEEEFEGDLDNLPDASFAGIVFFAPEAKLKITRTKRPVVLDKKTHFANRGGSNVKVDYIYSNDEFVDSIEVHRWNEQTQEWDISDQKFN